MEIKYSIAGGWDRDQTQAFLDAAKAAGFTLFAAQQGDPVDGYIIMSGESLTCTFSAQLSEQQASDFDAIAVAHGATHIE